MQKVGLSTAVSYGPFVKSFPQTLLEIADNYFGGKKVQVIAGYRQGRSEGVIDFDQQISNRTTFIIRLLYAASALPLIALAANKTSLKNSVALSLAVPALMLVGKIALRSMYPFHRVEEDNTTEFVGEELSKAYLPPPSTGTALEFDKLYRLSYKEMAALRIKLTDEPLRHNLPLTSNKFYSVPPHIHTGDSELSEYEDSFFEYRCMATYDEKKDTMVDTYYEVKRRKHGEGLQLNFDVPTEISLDQMINLRIIPVPFSKKTGYSILLVYKDSMFEYESIGDKYRVTRKRVERVFKFIPFNQEVILSQFEYAFLRLIDAKSDYEPVSGQKWNIFRSELDEFGGSRLLVSKFGNDYSVVRMMKPLETDGDF